MRSGRRWIARCAGIAAADGKCYGIVAQRVVAENSSSKLVAAGPGVSAALPRYRVCWGLPERAELQRCERAARRRTAGTAVTRVERTVLVLLEFGFEI